MSQIIKQQEPTENDANIRSVSGSNWTLDSNGDKIGDDSASEGAGQNDLEIPRTTTMDFTFSRPRCRPLPAELNREIYLCFNLTNQHKYIWGLGWAFYAMFRHSHRLLIKIKKVRNPQGNLWNGTNTIATVAADGLRVLNRVAATADIFSKHPQQQCNPQWS